MEFITRDTIGEAWSAAHALILREGKAQVDGEQRLKELLHLSLEISDPLENDPIARNQDPVMANWMRDNFTKVARVPELGNAWSYAWRLYEFNGIDQIAWVTKHLREKPETKSATITTLQAAGLEPYVPCVSLLDFKRRDGDLWLTATCRSLDFGLKALYNLTNLAALAREVGEDLELSQTHLMVHVMSAHIYEPDWTVAQPKTEGG